jgi:alpha-amylase
MKKNFTTKIKTFVLAFLMLGYALNFKAQAPAQCTDVVLQAFGWDSYQLSKWTNLNAMASEIGANFDMVWLPPSGNDLNPSNSMGYLPVYYFNQNSSFGSQAELISLISSLKNNGARAMADVVINHRNGATNWTDFPSETYKGLTYSWGPETICNGDEVKDAAGQATPTGANDTGENYAAARDIDHTNSNVQNTIKAYLDFLKNEIGYDGWRYDLVKGFSGNFIEMYNNSANAHLSVGEFWDGNYDYVKGWIDATNKTSTAFDFPQKYQINKAFNNGLNLTELVWAGQPAGLAHHATTKRYAMTFIDNHDTGRSDAGHDHSRFTGNVLAAHAFILSGPGIPCVWINHWNNTNYKAKINELIAARKKVGLHSESPVTVNHSASDIYVATATGLSGSLIVKIGTAAYSAPDDYQLQTSGPDYAVWTKGGQEIVEPTPAGPIKVQFKNTDNWSQVKIYAWTDSGAILGDWPGIPATTEADNWVSYLFDESVTKVNVVFNNGSNEAQTGDITNITSSGCYVFNGHKAVPLITDCPQLSTYAPVASVTKAVPTIFPNPATKTITISFAQGATVDIININGSIVLSKSIMEGSTSVDLSNLQPGLYFVVIEDENGNTSVEKLLKK